MSKISRADKVVFVLEAGIVMAYAILFFIKWEQIKKARK
jgi:hypothetical protein